MVLYEKVSLITSNLYKISHSLKNFRWKHLSLIRIIFVLTQKNIYGIFYSRNNRVIFEREKKDEKQKINN